jgi:hypothetical protein
MTKTFYSELLAKKKPWTPTIGKSSSVMEGSEETIGRAIALRTLEIPVGDWILLGCKREMSRLPDDAIKLMQSNIEDEFRHDEVLNMAYSAYQLTDNTMESEAAIIAEEWIDHPDHPVVKAWVIENSVFFVILPILRKFGDAGLRLISRDISNDENIHVSTNRQIATDLGYSYSKSLDNLRKRTVEWVVETLNSPGKFGFPDVWLKSSDTLLYQGVAPELSDTANYVMPAFFELDNRNLPSYY